MLPRRWKTELPVEPWRPSGGKLNLRYYPSGGKKHYACRAMSTIPSSHPPCPLDSIRHWAREFSPLAGWTEFCNRREWEVVVSEQRHFYRKLSDWQVLSCSLKNQLFIISDEESQLSKEITITNTNFIFKIRNSFWLIIALFCWIRIRNPEPPQTESGFEILIKLFRIRNTDKFKLPNEKCNLDWSSVAVCSDLSIFLATR